MTALGMRLSDAQRGPVRAVVYGLLLAAIGDHDARLIQTRRSLEARN
jgi:hypothetical protein